MSALMIGPVAISVGGGTNIADLVRDELSGVPLTDREPELKIEIGGMGDRTEAASVRLEGRSRLLLRHKAAIGQEGLVLEVPTEAGITLYRVRLTSHPYSSAPVHVRVSTPFDSDAVESVSRPLFRMLTRDFLSLQEIIAKNIIYEILDPVLWCKLLAHNATLVHGAAAASPQGHGILLLGAARVGKSIGLAQLVLEDGWSYLADDLAVIDAGGRIVRYPKHIPIYAGSTEQVSGAESRLLSGRSMADRNMWRLRRSVLGPWKTRRRVRPADFFGLDRIRDRASLDAAFMLLPDFESRQPSIARTSPEAVARTSANDMLDFVWDFLRLLNRVAVLDAELPTLEDVSAKTFEVLREKLPEDACYELRVPATVTGPRITDLIDSAL